ncbi:MAG: type II secretion system F family protein [Nanoarchaeota archaeon]
MTDQGSYIIDLKKLVEKEAKVVKELIGLFREQERSLSAEEKDMISSNIKSLKSLLSKTNDDIYSVLEDMTIVKPLPETRMKAPEFKIETRREFVEAKPSIIKHELTKVEKEIDHLDRKTLKRLKKKERKKRIIKEKKPSKYVGAANKLFGSYAESLSKKSFFVTLRRELVKAHLQFIPKSFIAAMLFTSFLSIFAAIFVFMFFLFFNISSNPPFITKVAEAIGSRVLKTFWILIFIPLATFFGMYLYPSLEKKFLENKVNEELPFATIHMAAISGSLVEPSKMFNILISTGDYPSLSKEFTKLINEINVYGYDFVNALRSCGASTASKKLGELYNGLATAINSGGSIQNFFDKKSQSFLFDYQLERERYTKTAETFMDIYISLVIAAPMILMLLLIMMSVSGLGTSFSTSTITLLMILGVTMINILFLTFLQLKQPQS